MSRLDSDCYESESFDDGHARGQIDKRPTLEPKMGGLVCPHCSRVVATPDKAASYLSEPLIIDELRNLREWALNQIGGGPTTQEAKEAYLLIDIKCKEIMLRYGWQEPKR